jgi:four helix bundle protein
VYREFSSKYSLDRTLPSWRRLMSRDHRKLNVFSQADALVLQVYAETATYPSDERFGLRNQVRRAAVSVPTNIVEGCARRKQGEYLQFINIATGSAAETLYLLDLSNRLGFLKPGAYRRLEPKYSMLIGGLKKLQTSLECEE